MCAGQNCTCWGVSRYDSDDRRAVAELGIGTGSEATAGGTCAAACVLVLTGGTAVCKPSGDGAYTENLRNHESHL